MRFTRSNNREMDLVATVANNGGASGTFNAIYTHSGWDSHTAWITITTPGDPSLTAMGPFCENLPIQFKLLYHQPVEECEFCTSSRSD